MVKGVRVRPSSNQNIDSSKDAKQPNVKNIIDFASESMKKNNVRVLIPLIIFKSPWKTEF